MLRVWNIFEVNAALDMEKLREMFVEIEGFNAEGRANEVVNRLRAQEKNDEVSYDLREWEANLTNGEIGLEPTLQEAGSDGLVELALNELKVKGKMIVPLWINPAWLVHEMRNKYEVRVTHRNRLVTLGMDDSVDDEDSSTIPTQRGCSADPDDAGFTETEQY